MQGKQDDRLSRELGDLQNSVRQKDDEIERLRKDIAKLEYQVTTSGGNNSELQKQIDFLQVQCGGLENQLKKNNDEKRKLEEEIAKLKANQGAKTKPLPIILCVLFGIVAAVLGFLYANKGGDSIPGDYNTLKTENAELMNTNKDLQSRINGYEKQVTDLNAEIDDLKKSNPLPSAREKELQTQLNQTNSKISDLEEQIKAKDAEIKRLKNSNQSPSTREKELESKLNQANSTINSLKKELEKKKVEI